MMQNSPKTYVLDYATLTHSPYSLYAFEENTLIVPEVVIRELRNPGNMDLAANIQKCNELLGEIEKQGDLRFGVSLPNGGTIKVFTISEALYLHDNLDARLGCDTLELSRKEAEKQAYRTDIGTLLVAKLCRGVLVSSDPNLRVMANVMGIRAEEYKGDMVVNDDYTGRCDVYVSRSDLDQFHKYGTLGVPKEGWAYGIGDKMEFHHEFTVNEFVALYDSSNPESYAALGRYDGSKIVPLRYERVRPNGISPRNIGQIFALEALLAPAEEAPLVILKGPAGTAKTFLSLAAGLKKVEDGEFRSILVSRPNVKFDDDIGYLKGGEQEKIGPLIRPIYDNIQNLFNVFPNKKDGARVNPVDYYFDTGIIVAQAMAYMRGRSISDTYILIDEAQNASLTQVFGLITRPGERSKLVIVGDPEQIDTPSLNKHNNGLSVAAAKMRGSELCWQVTFAEEESTRSQLAKAAIERLSPKGHSVKKKGN